MEKRITKSDRLPFAGEKVDGRAVAKGSVPNISSIGASLDEYEILSDIREMNMEFFSYSPPYSKSEFEKTKELSEKIKESNIITPLIVVEDNLGFYILEGIHRFDALCMLGAKSFPALVVKDLDSLKEFY